ncbi:MAG: hypothetical protein ACI3Y5_02655, partial [Prevotella sp.]
MGKRLYLKVAAVIMAITALPMLSLTAQAQREVQVVELQKQPDGTEIHVPKTIEVPEKSAEEVAAAKRKAATATAEEDDLQYFLNNLAKTRAGESTVVIDLSTFSATTRETTLEVSNGLSLKFTNGTLKRGTGLAKGSPMIRISNGTVVEFDETVIISGENLTTNGSAVELQDASLRTAAWIGNTQWGTENSYSYCIYASSSLSKLEVVGGTIDGSIRYYGQNPIRFSSCSLTVLLHSSSSDVIFDGETVDFKQYTPEYNNSRVSTKSPIKKYRIYDQFNVLGDGVALMHGADDYQLTSSDVDKLGILLPSSSPLTISDYEKRLEGDSIVLRKKVKDIQSAINNAADNTETTINLDNYGELTTGILIPTGKKIKMTGTKNVTLASNFTGDYIFRTEGDAQLDITIPGFSASTYPKYAFVAGGGSSKIQINQYGESIMVYPNTLLYTENGGTIDCYSKITKTTFYNSTGGTINIYSDGDVLNPTAEEGSTTNITGKIFFSGTFTAEGTVSMRGDIISNLTNLVLGKNSLVTFTTNVTDAKNLIASFKNNDYTLGKAYIYFLGYDHIIKFSLLDDHTATIDRLKDEEGKYHKGILIVECDRQQVEAAWMLFATKLSALAEHLVVCEEDSATLDKKISENYSSGNLTSEEYAELSMHYDVLCRHIKTFRASLSDTEEYFKSVDKNSNYIYEEIRELESLITALENGLFAIKEEIASLQSDLDTILASHKKTFTNTDDLQDYLNSLAQNNETTPDDPAKVSVADGTELDDVEIPEGTHVEIDVDGNGGESGDDLQAYLNGLVTVKEGGSLTLRGNYTL